MFINMVSRGWVAGGGGKGGGTPILGQYGYVPPENPQFSAWAAPKDSTFFTWTAPKDSPFQKYAFICSTFPTWAASKDPPLKKYTFLCYVFVPKSPSFSLRGRSESPPFSVTGRSLSPPPHFQTLGGTHTYIYI